MCLIMKVKHDFEKHVDLLQLSNSKNSEYILIKNFNRFMTNKTKHRGEKTLLAIFLTMLF